MRKSWRTCMIGNDVIDEREKLRKKVAVHVVVNCGN